MAGTMKFFRDLFKKAVYVFVNNGLCFTRLFIVFFIPLVVWHFFYVENSKLIQMIIDQFTITGFRRIDNAIHCIVLVYFFLYLVAIVQSVHAAVRGGNPGVIASYRKALGIFSSYLWVKTLSLFQMLCWSLLLIVPGVIKGVFYNFSGMALLIDGKRGKEALIQSQTVIKPNVVKYLVSSSFVAIILIIVCVSITVNLNSFITFFYLNGKTFLAGVVICSEIGLYAIAISFFLTFYYCLYTTLREGAED